MLNQETKNNLNNNKIKQKIQNPKISQIPKITKIEINKNEINELIKYIENS